MGIVASNVLGSSNFLQMFGRHAVYQWASIPHNVILSILNVVCGQSSFFKKNIPYPWSSAVRVLQFPPRSTPAK